MTPGVHYGVPISEYHADQGSISKSGLDLIARSPYHYWARYLDPASPTRWAAPTPSMVLGTMTHCLVLEPSEFDTRYRVEPTVDRRTKAGKEEYAAFVAGLRPHQEAADQEMTLQAQAMAASVRAIAPLRDLLAKGDPEVSAFFTDPGTGVACRCRPDWVSPAGDGVIIVDVKSTADASPEAFARSVANYGYARQAALYSDGFAIASGVPVHAFVLAVVEKDYPCAAAAYMLTEESLDYGRRQYRTALRIYSECLHTNTWPSYTAADEIRLISLPPWSLSKDTE